MDRCDVLIVGGGPAGSSCAWALVRRGFDVVLIDRAVFPRGKTCAGWITPQVADSLELDLDGYARRQTLQPFTGFLAGLIDGPTRCIRYPETVSYGIRRLEFDRYLLERCGARVFTGTPLHGAVRVGGEWQVNGRWQAPLLVGAGGHGCPVARLVGADPGRAEHAFCAREAEFLMDRALALRCRVNPVRGELYFCRDLAGYGWCLRKGNYLNIGLGREGPAGLAADLDRLLHHLADAGHLPLDAAPRFRGHAYLSWESSRRPLVADGCVLVGDAAGMASARSGEGIRRAVESALLAAEALAEALGNPHHDGLERYRESVEARFGSRPRDASAAEAPRWLSRLRQRIGRRLLSNPPFLRHLVLDRYFLQRDHPALPRMGTTHPSMEHPA